jgi:hypothetical protein
VHGREGTHHEGHEEHEGKDKRSGEGVNLHIHSSDPDITPRGGSGFTPNHQAHTPAVSVTALAGMSKHLSHLNACSDLWFGVYIVVDIGDNAPLLWKQKPKNRGDIISPK